MLRIRVFLSLAITAALLTDPISAKYDALDKHVVEAFFTKSLERFRDVLISGSYQLHSRIFDPYSTRDKKIEVEDHQARMMLHAEDVTMEHLSRYEVTNVTYEPRTDKVYFTMSLPTLKLRGNYVVDGSLEQQQPLYGQGPYGVTLHAAELAGHAVFVRYRKTAEVKDLQLSLKHKALATGFYNLAIPSSAGLSTKDLGMKLGRALAARIAQDTLPDIGQTMAAFINLEIVAVSPVPTVAEEGNGNDYMDQVLALVRQRIVELSLDRVRLPDGDISFSVPVWPMDDSYGGVYLHDGFMGGMETIHRVGNATLSFTDTDVFFESELAITSGILGYSLTIVFMDIGPTASMTGTLSYVNVYFKARLSLSTGEILIEEYNIKEIGHIDTDITGLGMFNWLAEIITDFAINLIKGFVKELLEGPIRNIIQWALDQILAALT